MRSMRLRCAPQVVHLDTGVRWLAQAPNVTGVELPPILIRLVDFFEPPYLTTA